jgi:hypothetical protein
MGSIDGRVSNQVRFIIDVVSGLIRGYRNPVNDQDEALLGYVYVGTWEGRPSPSAAPEGARIAITNIGNQGHLYLKNVSGAWRLTGPQAIYLNETQAAGSNAGTAEQALFTTPGLPRSFIECLRYYRTSIAVTKNGAVTTAQIIMREGNTGDLTDTSVYSSQALIGTTPGTAARTGAGGMLRKYNAATERTQGFTSAIHVGLDTGASTTSVFPVNASGVLTDTTVYLTVAAVLAASGSDVPALERILIEGY